MSRATGATRARTGGRGGGAAPTAGGFESPSGRAGKAGGRGDRGGILFKLAWRNLWKNRRRTLITLSMISGGFALALVSLGLGDGFHNQMIRNAIRLGSGHLTVERRDYLEEPSNDKLIRHPGPLREEIARLEGVANVSERIIVMGLLYTTENSVGVAALGVDPASDMTRRTLEPKVVEGRYLAADDGRGILIGADLARKLKIRVGGKAVLTAQDASGEISSQLVRVRGIFRTGINEMDGYFAEVSLPLARALLGVPDGATQLAVFLEDPGGQAEIKGRIVALVTDPGIGVFDWQEVMRDLVLFVEMDNAGNYIFMGIIMVIVALGILNTILMSVLERTREFGLVMALGMAPRRLLAQVVLETTMLALLGLGAGAVLGLAGHGYLAVHGFNMGFGSREEMTAVGVVLDPVIYSDLEPSRALTLAAVVFVVTLLVGIYPAVQASRVNPVQAIRKFH